MIGSCSSRQELEDALRASEEEFLRQADIQEQAALAAAMEASQVCQAPHPGAPNSGLGWLGEVSSIPPSQMKGMGEKISASSSDFDTLTSKAVLNLSRITRISEGSRSRSCGAVLSGRFQQCAFATID